MLDWMVQIPAASEGDKSLQELSPDPETAGGWADVDGVLDDAGVRAPVGNG
jgi:hypothetical protein